MHKHNSETFLTFDYCLVVFYQNNKKFPLTKEILNQPIYLNLTTKLNFSSSNPNIFYIVTSSTITDKCTLVRDLCKLFQQCSFPRH